MPLSRQDIEKVIEKALPGFTIVDQPATDAPELFAKPEANTPDLQEIQKKLGAIETPATSPPQPAVSTDDITTVPVRSPDNPLQPTAGSQLKYVFISNKTGDILAIQG